MRKTGGKMLAVLGWSNKKGKVMKMKIMLGAALLACVPLAVAETHYNYPKAKLAELAVERRLTLRKK
jgi:hypothetical protein